MRFLQFAVQQTINVEAVLSAIMAETVSTLRE